MSLISVVWCLTITCLFSMPLIYCKPKKKFQGQYAKTFMERRKRKRKDQEKKKEKTTPDNKIPSVSPSVSSTPTAETPGSRSPPKKGTKDTEALEPTQSGEQENSQPLISKKQEPPKKKMSKEPSTAKEKFSTKTAKKIPVPIREEYMEDQNEDETMVGVKSIE
ncbi:hypothetical protein CRE_02872 [Caenorhabditis remanei]|uniref:Uncharacterized protein n=1 Tax=Caenorhabditis remanei TaxID=31234 RepID=E3LWD1_CAERE|nr:hypothetical protein CRE_02872 [Caenorhabditis remanei]